MRAKQFVSGILFAAAVAAPACMWDQDTIMHEQQEMPDVLGVAIGWFERNPPLYYQMRINRELPLVKAHPQRLDLYDDLGVACARLGKEDDAIAWMDRKKSEMGDLSRARTVDGKRDAFSEAGYRYYANLGTFWFHRWARQGAKKETLGQAKHARDLIARAIEINPDAHFGREKVQLQVMDWMISTRTDANPMDLPSWAGFGNEFSHPAGFYQANIRGLIGLIVLGAAWESPDCYNALAALVDGSTHSISKLGYFVRQRVIELVDSGHEMTVPDESFDMHTGRTNFLDAGHIRSEFRRLRRVADRWQQERTDFMLARLN